MHKNLIVNFPLSSSLCQSVMYAWPLLSRTEQYNIMRLVINGMHEAFL
jgi:hypothetical protein